MDKEFISAFGAVFGSIAGLTLVVAAFTTGRKIGNVENTVTATVKIAAETRDAVKVLADNVNGRLGKLEFAAWGVDGRNGMRGEQHRQREEIEELQKDRRSQPGRRHSDRQQEGS